MDKYTIRFWERVDKYSIISPILESNCWTWIKPLERNGYARIKWRGFPEQLVHRASWFLTYGPIPTGLWILHTCDVKHCVRPEHLYLGTIKENGRDAAQRQRTKRGSEVNHSKLTESQAKEILSLFASGKYTKLYLAKKYCISHTAVRYIISGKNWKYLER